MTTSEAAKLRWAGMTPEERSEFMRQVSLKAWAERKKRKKSKGGLDKRR